MEMENFKLSLLYPDGGKKESLLDRAVARDLSFDELIPLAGAPVSEYYSADAETLRYRAELFSDLEKVPEAGGVLKRMLPYLADITDLRRIERSEDVAEGYLYELTEIEIYHSLMSFMKSELLPLKEKFASRALRSLADKIEELTEGDYYKDLTKHLDELSNRVRDVRSVTIGVNLDSRMMPESSGVISVNGESFKSGNFFDRVKRLDFKTDEMTFIAKLVPFSQGQSENARLAMMNAVNNAVSSVFKSSVSSWKEVIRSYVLENTDFLIGISEEVEFIIKAAELTEKLREKNVPLTYPEFTEDKRLEIRGLVNPAVALATDDVMIANDVEYKDDVTMFVLTGPNRGGKSVFTCAVGQAIIMAGLGLPVCAESCALSPADKVLTHFPGGSEDTLEKGRLGEECSRLGVLLDSVTEDSVVLLDESLSSTGSYEGALIAAEVLEGLALIGCYGIFSTHLHDLAFGVDKINASLGRTGIENLVAEAVGEGERSFKILKKTPDGKSYASDIAKEYGLSHSEISKKVEKKHKNPCNS